MMTTLTLELPVAGLPSAAELPANFADKAGRLCDRGRVEFLLAASRSGVPVVDLRGDELAEEFA